MTNDGFLEGLPAADGHFETFERRSEFATKRTLCVQRRLARSVGVSPTGVRVGTP